MANEARAAAEFQKILDHSGMCGTAGQARWRGWGWRAHCLGMKSSSAAEAEAVRRRALAAYKDFLALWKGADSDVPI